MSAERPSSGRTGPARPGRGSLLAVVVTLTGLLLTACGSVGGSPAPAAPPPVTAAPTGSKAEAPTSSAAASSGAQGGTVAADTTVPSASTTTAPAARTSTAPVAGLPHSTPLPATELVDSRSVDGVSDLYLVDTTTGMLGSRITKDLGGGQYPLFSPDRGTVVYLWQGREGNQIRVAAVDGSGDRSFLSATTAEACTNPGRPGWNPANPTELVVTCRTDDGSQMHLIGVDGSIRSTLYPGLKVFEDPTYSPDGSSIAFWGSADEDANGGNLYVMPANGSGPARQVTTPGTGEDVDPMWTVDGSALVFRRSVPGSGVGQILSVAVTGAAPGTITAVTDGTAFDFDPTVAPDGKQVAFKSNRTNAAGTQDNQVWVQNLDGTGLRQVALGVAGVSAGAPEWGRR